MTSPDIDALAARLREKWHAEGVDLKPFDEMVPRFQDVWRDQATIAIEWLAEQQGGPKT